MNRHESEEEVSLTDVPKEGCPCCKRIETKIVDHFTIGDTPILRFILNMDPTRDDLKKLSKALDRLADIVETYESLATKLSVIKAAESDPNWFALAFGDFENEIDEDIEKFFNAN
jgi:hypothetical protein